MSTDEQASLSEFKTAAEIREQTKSQQKDDKPNWSPMADDEPDCGNWARCEQCGSRISEDFKRVFGNNDNELEHGCRNCADYRQYTGHTGFGSGRSLGGQ